MRSRKLISGSLLSTLNLIAQIVAGFYLMPLMIHTFGDAMFGIWILVASFMGYAAVLDLGLPSAVSRFISQSVGRNNIDRDQEIASITATAFYIFLYITFFTLLILAVVYMLTPFFLKDSAQSDLFRTLLVILCLNNLFVFPTSVFEGILTAHLRHDLVNTRKIVFTLLRLVFTIAIIKMNGGLVAIAWATVGCNIVENLSRIPQSYQADSKISIAPRHFKWPMVRQLFEYSIYTFIGKIADTLRFQIDACVITVFSEISQITPFRIASRLIEYFMQFISGVTGVFSSYFSQEEGKNNFSVIREKFLFITKIITFIATFTGGMLVLYGKNFIARWVGPQYDVSYDILVILTIPITFALIQSAVFPLLYGISKHKFVAYINIGEGVLNVILSIVLVKDLGIYGVALGTAIPLLISKFFVQPVYITRILEIPMTQYISTINGPFLKSVLALAVPWLVIKPYLHADYVNLLFFGLLQAGLFVVVTYTFGFTDVEKKYLVSIVQKKR